MFKEAMDAASDSLLLNKLDEMAALAGQRANEIRRLQTENTRLVGVIKQANNTIAIEASDSVALRRGLKKLWEKRLIEAGVSEEEVKNIRAELIKETDKEFNELLRARMEKNPNLYDLLALEKSIIK